MDFKSEIVSLFDYYDAPGARDMAHRVKRGDDEACIRMAEAIAEAGVIPTGTKIIPVPSSSGEPTNNPASSSVESPLVDV